MPASRTASPPLALASCRALAATVSNAVTESAWSGNVQIPALMVSGSFSEASNWSERTVSVARRRSITSRRWLVSASGTSIISSSGPYRPMTAEGGASRVRPSRTVIRTSLPAECPYVSLSIRKLSTSTRATENA